MTPCPHCGAMLTAALVDGIRDPKNYDEMCPRRPKKAPAREIVMHASIDPSKRLLGYAVLGASIK